MMIPNPLIRHRADPHLSRHPDGCYYFTATVPEYDRIELRRATTLNGLPTAEPTVIWRKHGAGPMGAHIWAPELHHFDGQWHIYFAAGDAEDIWRIRIYVLTNPAVNPLEGAWTERGPVRTPLDTFALDATIFVHAGRRFLLWAQHDPAIGANTCLYLAPLQDAVTLAGPPVRISQPEHPWEKVRFAVNEGPAVLIRHDRVWVTYSAAGTGAEYCLGLLAASVGSDLLDAKSWHKSPTPVFTTSEAHRIYGPGHNSFCFAPDGTDLLVYHARSYRDIVGDPLLDPNRHTRVQPFTWRPDGSPDFGAPRPDDP